MTDFETLPERRVTDFRHGYDHSQSWEERMLGEDGKTYARSVQAKPWHETLFQPAFLTGDVVRLVHQDEYRIRNSAGTWQSPTGNPDMYIDFTDAEIRQVLATSPESYQYVGNLADLRPVPVEEIRRPEPEPEFVNPHLAWCRTRILTAGINPGIPPNCDCGAE